MPWNFRPGRARIDFMTSARMPSLIYKATEKLDLPSNTQYIQHALCEALSRDLGIPLEELMAELPPSRRTSSAEFGLLQPGRHGPKNTIEIVK